MSYGLYMFDRNRVTVSAYYVHTIPYLRGDVLVGGISRQYNEPIRRYNTRFFEQSDSVRHVLDTLKKRSGDDIRATQP